MLIVPTMTTTAKQQVTASLLTQPQGRARGASDKSGISLE